MTTMGTYDLMCPICSNEFSSSMIMSSNNFGDKTTDFQVIAVGIQPLPYFLHTCSKCGFSGYSSAFSEEYSSSEKRQIRKKLGSKPSNPLTDGKRYQFAAEIAEVLNQPAIRIANLYLKAAWCCTYHIASDPIAERKYREQARIYFQQAIVDKELDDNHIAVITYLIGELQRRLEEAKVVMYNAEELIDTPKLDWLKELIYQQIHDPQEMIS